MSKAEQAKENYHSGCNCAQAVIATYCEELGLDKDAALKLSCGFGSGMGKLGETCGAVSGAYMLIGLRHGEESQAAKDKTYELVREFSQKFKDRQNTTVCKELLAGQTAASKKEYCSRLVHDAAEIVEEMLEL